MQILRGDIVWVDLNPTKGSEQGKPRPCVVVQNDIGNKHAPTLIIVPLTSHIGMIYPTDVLLSNGSKALCSQIRTIDKQRIVKKQGRITKEEEYDIDTALLLSLGIEKI